LRMMGPSGWRQRKAEADERREPRKMVRHFL
jgi:hypothetical protein